MYLWSLIVQLEEKTILYCLIYVKSDNQLLDLNVVGANYTQRNTQVGFLQEVGITIYSLSYLRPELVEIFERRLRAGPLDPEGVGPSARRWHRSHREV